MVAIDVGFVFDGTEGDVINLSLNRATLKAILNELAGGVTYYNGDPTEAQSELVEQGISDITESLS